MSWWSRRKPEPQKSMSDLLGEDLPNVLTYAPPVSLLKAAVRICLELEQYPDYQKGAYVAVLETFGSIFRKLPRNYCLTWQELHEQLTNEERTSLTVPLHDVLDPGRAILDVVGPFCYGRLVEHGILAGLRKQLFENEANVHGISVYERRKKKLPLPHEMKEMREEPERMCRRFLRDTPFQDFFDTPIPFKIPDVRSEHVLMIASTGSGKTQFIQQDILSNLMSPDPPGMVVIDSQNQMIPKLERLHVARERIIIIDPFDATPPALNMFIAPQRNYDANLKEAIETETLQQFGWIFSALDQELTGRMNTLFTFTARILLAMAPHSNMMTLLEFLRIEKTPQLKASQFWQHIERSDDQTRYFFDERFCTSDFNKTKAGVADRLLGVMRVPAFNRMFMANENRLDLYRELAARKLIVFNTQKRMLGPDASAVLGRYAIALYVRAAFEREADRAPPQAFLYVDEASEYFGKKDSSDTLFTQLRKYNCGTFVAFQDVSQLAQQTGTLISNTATKLAARVSPADAGVLAAAMRTSVEHLLDTKKQDGIFQMSCYIKDVMPHALRVTFPYGAVENAPKLTDEEHKALRAENRKRVGIQTEEPVKEQRRFTEAGKHLEIPSETREGPSKPEPAAQAQQANELSPRDTNLPPPDPRPQPAEVDIADEPVVKPGKEWE